MLCCSWAHITIMKLSNHTQHQKIQPLKLTKISLKQNLPFPETRWNMSRDHSTSWTTQKKDRMVSTKVIMDEHDLSHITPTSPAEPIHPRCWAHDVWSIMSSCQHRDTVITKDVNIPFCSDHTDTCLFDTEGQINMGFASVPYSLLLTIVFPHFYGFE